MNIRCVVCETVFYDYHKEPRKYCSRKCYDAARTGKPRPQTRKREVRKCVVCEKDFETGGRAGNRKLFCSRVCQAFARVQHSDVRKMNLADASYLAGLMDGEGSIVLAKKRQMRATWRLQVSNTYFPLLEWCKTVTGCGSVTRKVSTNPKHADSGNWQCYSWNARSILLQILPYMRIPEKIRRAQLLISELDEIIKTNSLPI